MVDTATTSVEKCSCGVQYSVVKAEFEPHRSRIKSYGYAAGRRYDCWECGRWLSLQDHSQPNGYLVTYHLQKIE